MGVKREADFTARFGRWVRTPEARSTLEAAGIVLKGAVAFEFKTVKANAKAKDGYGRLALSAVKSWQIEALKRASEGKGGGLWHKISDSAAGFKPLDAVYLFAGSAFVVVEYQATHEKEKTQGEAFMAIWDVVQWETMHERKGGKGSIDAIEAKTMGAWLPMALLK